MDGYRDERGAALARLEQLEVEEDARLAARAPELREQLEAERVALLRRAPGAARTGLLVLAATLLGAVLFLNAGTVAVSGTVVAAVVVALAMILVYVAGDVRENQQRARRIAALAAELAALDTAKTRVELPTELSAIHARIAELEAEQAPDLDEVTPPPRTPRSAGTSR